MAFSIRAVDGDKNVKCSAVSCSNSAYTNSSVSYFRFPADGAMCKTWLINCGRRDLDEIFKHQPLYPAQNCWLCSEHFDSRQFLSDKPNTSLKPNAVPTVFSLDSHIVEVCAAKTEEYVDQEEKQDYEDDDDDEDFEPNNHESSSLSNGSCNRRRPRLKPALKTTKKQRQHTTSGRPRVTIRGLSKKLSELIDRMPAARAEVLDSTLEHLINVLGDCTMNELMDRVRVLHQLCEVWCRGETVDVRCNEPESVTARLASADLEKLVDMSHSAPVFIRLEYQNAGSDGRYKPAQQRRPFVQKYRPPVMPVRQPGDPVLPYKCDICSRTYRYYSQLEAHRRHHDGVRPYACHMCDQRFALAVSRDKHETSHSAARPLQCDTCGRCFAHQSYLRSHQRMHAADRERKPHACRQCTKRFTNAASLRQHAYSQHDDVAVKSDDIDNVTDDSDDEMAGLIAPLPQKQPPSPRFTCDKCGMSFTTLGHVRWHLRRVHAAEDAADFLPDNPTVVERSISRSDADRMVLTMKKEDCKTVGVDSDDNVDPVDPAKLLQCSCSAVFSSTTALQTHASESHCDVEASNCCPLCPLLEFTDPSDLEAHLRQHALLTCTTCGIACVDAASFYDHQCTGIADTAGLTVCGTGDNAVDTLSKDLTTTESVTVTIGTESVGMDTIVCSNPVDGVAMNMASDSVAMNAVAMTMTVGSDTDMMDTMCGNPVSMEMVSAESVVMEITPDISEYVSQQIQFS